MDNTVQIFVGGYMHSGTTLLNKMLKKHSCLFGYDIETRLMAYLRSYSSRLKKCSMEGRYQEFVAMFVDSLNLDEDDLRYLKPMFEELDVRTPSALFQDISNRLATYHQNSGWVEKTPSNVYFVDTIKEHFPGSKIILIYRDFRDVLASKKTRTQTVESGRYASTLIPSKKLEKDWNVIADSLSWNKSIDAHLNAVEKYPKEIISVSYEDFVRRPETEWRRICNNIGIPFEDESLNIDFSNRASIDPSRKGETNIYSSSVAGWKSSLSKREIVLGTFLTKGRLKRLNYEVFQLDTIQYILLPLYFLFEIPGVLIRIYKRFRFLGWKRAVIFSRNYFRRLTIKRST